MTHKRYNIVKAKKIVEQGQERTIWTRVGKLVLFTKDDGSESGLIELISFDKDIELNVFPERRNDNFAGGQNKNDYSQPDNKNDYSQPEPPDEDEIKVENIPF